MSGPAPVELLAGNGHLFPQLGVRTAIHAGDRSELGGDGAEPLARDLPVGTTGEALTFRDECFLRLDRRGGPSGPLRSPLGLSRIDRGEHRLEPAGQGLQIADDRGGVEGGQ